MNRTHGRHSGFGRTPAKGTKARQALLLLIRPQGATSKDICRLYAPKDQSTTLVEYFRNEKGWDIRTSPLAPEDPRQQDFSAKKRRPPVVHRIVGRMRWDGSYRSFVDPTQNRGPLRRPR